MLRKPNSNNPRYEDEYSKFRKKVLRRDRYRCQMPGCKATRRLQVHHIIRWADSVSLRYNVSNGISLCLRHHQQVTGHENQYARLFISIVSKNNEK